MTDRITLLKRLKEAEEALHQLMIGKSAVSLSRGDAGGNSRSYQYAQADIPRLERYISQLKSRLGLCNGRRRPAGVRL
ncbi:gpW family protein [Enterobacter sp. ASE]|uniref:gpW family protein n=1 Tax=Enterobacter sp. ASE TaxID=2905968 RepID=UPI001E58C18B|nr:gpW family protein [Enterobacter sp. ASE]MCE3118273.1 gpW family protein [Enterobacter sp. ASE]